MDGILGRVCASKEVADATVEFERAHGPCPALWRGLVVATMALPSDFMLEDLRTNAEKAKSLGALLGHVRGIARVAQCEADPPAPPPEPSLTAQPLSVRAKDFDERAPAEYFREQVWRRLHSPHRRYRPNLLEDIHAEPTYRGDPLCEIDAAAFGSIARRLVGPIEAAIERLSGPEPILLLKGHAWHRYAVARLEAVFAGHFVPEPLQRLHPGPNKAIAAFANAAVPASKFGALSLKRVSEIRIELSIRKNTTAPPFHSE